MLERRMWQGIKGDLGSTDSKELNLACNPLDLDVALSPGESSADILTVTCERRETEGPAWIPDSQKLGNGTCVI